MEAVVCYVISLDPERELALVQRGMSLKQMALHALTFVSHQIMDHSSTQYVWLACSGKAATACGVGCISFASLGLTTLSCAGFPQAATQLFDSMWFNTQCLNDVLEIFNQIQ